MNEIFSVKLTQIATINAGYPFRGKISEVAGSSVVAVQMKDASPRDGIHWDRCVRTKLTGKRIPDWLEPGDILVAARGSHNYAVQIDEAGLETGVQAVAAPHFFVVSLKRKDILAGYLAWFLNQEPVQRYFEQNAEGSLTKSIRRSVLEETPLAVPTLTQQRAIVGLATALRKEQRFAEQLLRNGERIMGTIASDLLVNPDRV
jgi:hypothetical protein